MLMSCPNLPNSHSSPGLNPKTRPADKAGPSEGGQSIAPTSGGLSEASAASQQGTSQQGALHLAPAQNVRAAPKRKAADRISDDDELIEAMRGRTEEEAMHDIFGDRLVIKMIVHELEGHPGSYVVKFKGERGP